MHKTAWDIDREAFVEDVVNRAAALIAERGEGAFGQLREQGVGRTLKRTRGKLSAGSATGYSAAGVVVARSGTRGAATAWGVLALLAQPLT